MEITYDPAKREVTLQVRGIDFGDATFVFAGETLALTDDRHDYGELRLQTFGALMGRPVIVVWTPRGMARHIISMRYCHERETQRARLRLDRSR